MRRASNVILPGVIALVFCAPLFRGLRAVDQENDEAIYSYAVESILETGDWLNPRSAPNADIVFLEKPPLKFWIVALPIRLGLMPDNDFGLRFWDAAFGSLAFLYIFSFGRRMGGWPCGVAALVTLYAFGDLIFIHGLRANNMEAALVLAYAGGIYHYLRWAEAATARGARAHAAAVGFYFFLGFMTKFVAALFLPAVIGAASLELPAVRSRVATQWKTWLVVCAGTAVLVAPWFVYQTLHAGWVVWSTMFGEHVLTRFRTSVDPSHLKPWHFYFAYFLETIVQRGAWWAVLAGALLIHARVLRERWLAGTLVLYWFWLPFVLISLGSSKLVHYAYPFLAPAGLAAGYFVGSASNAAARAMTALAGRARARGPGRGLSALLLGVLAGRGAWVVRLAVPLVLLSFLPFSEYASAVRRTGSEAHPMRSVSDCIARVRQDERAAGRPVRDMYVYLPGRTYMHSYFFYFRTFGWDRHDELPDSTLLGMLDDPAEQRPVLMPDDLFSRILEAHYPPGTFRPARLVGNGMRAVLPGPYAGCAADTSG